MNVLLIPNFDKKDSVPCTNKAIEILLRLSAVPMLEQSLRPCVQERPGCVFGEFSALLSRCDVLLAIGGDGTVLHAMRHAVEADKPLMGVNTGRIGFLAQIEGSELECLKLLVQGNYGVERRMLLEAVNGGNGRSVYALNDVIVTRDIRRLMEVTVYSGDNLIIRHRADGLIFATPTGSTAYSLSAGGPVVDPALSLILVTAICPHSNYNRSFVLPADAVYTVRPEGDAVMEVVVDGEYVDRIARGESVRIRRSEKGAKLIHLGLRDFYTNLRKKMI